MVSRTERSFTSVKLRKTKSYRNVAIDHLPSRKQSPFFSFGETFSSVSQNTETFTCRRLLTGACEPIVRARPSRSIFFHFAVTPCYFLLLCPPGHKKIKTESRWSEEDVSSDFTSHQINVSSHLLSCQRVLLSTLSTNKKKKKKHSQGPCLRPSTKVCSVGESGNYIFVTRGPEIWTFLSDLSDL